jgi:hypothetical protein
MAEQQSAATKLQAMQRGRKLRAKAAIEGGGDGGDDGDDGDAQ